MGEKHKKNIGLNPKVPVHEWKSYSTMRACTHKNLPWADISLACRGSDMDLLYTSVDALQMAARCSLSFTLHCEGLEVRALVLYWFLLINCSL